MLMSTQGLTELRKEYRKICIDMMSREGWAWDVEMAHRASIWI